MKSRKPLYWFLGVVGALMVIVILALVGSEPAEPTPLPTYTPAPAYTPLPTYTPAQASQAQVRNFCLDVVDVASELEDPLNELVQHAFEGMGDLAVLSDQAYLEEATDLSRGLRKMATEFRALDAPAAAQGMHKTVLELADTLDTIGANYGKSIAGDDLDAALKATAAMQGLEGLALDLLAQVQEYC